MARTHLERRYALLEKLAELTPKMRHAQRQYFKTRDRGWMNESVEFEGKVDRVIEELAGPDQTDADAETGGGDGQHHQGETHQATLNPMRGMLEDAPGELNVPNAPLTPRCVPSGLRVAKRIRTPAHTPAMSQSLKHYPRQRKMAGPSGR